MRTEGIEKPIKRMGLDLGLCRDVGGIETVRAGGQPDPTETMDIEIRLGEDWIRKLTAGY